MTGVTVDATAGSDAARLFAEAIDLVRSFAPRLASDPPAFELPSVEPGPAPVPGAGPTLGPAGDLWATADDLREGRLTVAALVERSAERIARYDKRFHVFEHLADMRAEGERLDRAAREDRWDGRSAISRAQVSSPPCT